MVTIIVRNLHPDVTRDDLQELFERYGVVSGVDVVDGQDFCYVRMRGASDAHQAIRALNHQMCHGRSIEVQEARPYRYRTRTEIDAPATIRK